VSAATMNYAKNARFVYLVDKMLIKYNTKTNMGELLIKNTTV